MQASLSGVRRRLVVVLAVTAVLFAGLAALTGSRASAQQGPTAACDGDINASFPPAVFGDIAHALIYPDRPTITIDLPAPLEPGTYAVKSVTYDGDHNRVTDQGQHQEIITLTFLGAGGETLHTTGPTVDLEDGVLEATAKSDLGEMTIDAPAVAVRADHAATEATSKHSLHPVCVELVGVQVLPSTTTSTTTTIDETTSSTSTTEQPKGTEPPKPKTTERVPPQPTVSVLPQTTTPNTTPPAPTVVGTPRFTG